MTIQLGLDLGGQLDGKLRRRLGFIDSQFLVEHLLESLHATIADVHARPGHQFADFCVAFATEAAQGEIARTGHGYFSLMEDLSGKVGTSVREVTTSSTRPNALASSALIK